MGRIILLLLVITFLGCGTRESNAPTEESTTSGTLTVYCESTLVGLMRQEAAAFDSLYPSAHITILPRTATDAVIDLLTDKTKCIVIGRELNPRETQAVAQYHIDTVRYAIAYSALAIVVNRSSNEKFISVEKFKERLVGKGGARMLSPAYSDLYALYSDSMLLAGGKNISTADTIRSLLKFLKSSSRAIAAIEWAAIAHDSSFLRTVKILDVSGRDSLGVEQKPVMLHPAYIYGRTYPLRKTLYGYTTSGNRSLAKGFLAFVTSAPGQSIVTKFGLVTATMPVRLVPSH